MAPRHPPTSTAIATALALSCATPEAPPVDPAAIQRAAAEEIVRSIVSAPGAIVAICVGYDGDGEPPGPPAVDAPMPLVTGVDGCEERDGRLVSTEGGGQAISVSVGVPEATHRLRAAVSVFTSTGPIDLAAYTCRVRYRDSAWRSEGCGLDAIS